MALRLQTLMAEPLPNGLLQLKGWNRNERLNSAMGQSGRKDMDVLLVAVRLHHHLLIAPHHLVKLLLDAVQRQAIELTAQRSCRAFYRRFSSLSALFSFFCVWFFVWFLWCCSASWRFIWRLLCWASFALSLSVRVC